MLQQNKYNSLKALALLLLCGLCVNHIAAQTSIKPNSQITSPAPTVNVLTKPTAYNSGIKVNYVQTKEAIAPFTTEAAFNAAGYEQVKQATQYLDGLGRPIQTVVKQASTTGLDIVSSNVYDEFGREAVKYMPYISAASDGNFKLDPFTQQLSFNQVLYNGEQVFYSQTEFEASPLNRPLKSMAPGNSWGGNGRGLSISYEINDANEVRIWDIDANNRPIAATASYYDAGQLYRTITTDEHDKKVVEYKDKEGKVILKKVQIGNSPTITSHTDWLCTYYVYDDFGLLRCVIPPKATEYLAKPANNWTFPTYSANGIFDELCFQYTYDASNRMVTKKVPGAAIVCMVYDQRDRLIMTQDGKLKEQGKWMVTVYENSFNRPVATYLYTNANNQATHQAAANGSIAYPATAALASAELLTETYYDNYTWTTAAALPNIFDANQFDNGSPYYLLPSNSAAPYTQPYNPTTNTLGQATGSKVKVLGTTNTYLYAVSFYDDKGRVIQIKSTLLGGGTSTTTNQYDFSGKILRSITTQARTGFDETSIVSLMEYDHTGKLLTLKKDINYQGLKTIVSNTYNELGQLKSKALGTDMTTTEPVETLDYTYNIRGWLTGINRGFANPLYTAEYNNQQNRWFGMQLSYDYGFDKSGNSNGMFNGNIAGQIWKSKSNGKQRAYGYDYDAANRLMKADFNSYVAPPPAGTVGSWDKSDGYDFSVTMGNGTNPATAYDANGNIKAMKQMGYVNGSSVAVDELSYEYFNNTNKLRTMWDAGIYSPPTTGLINDPNILLGDFRYNKNKVNKDDGDQDYTYDVNGNLTQDFNKAISTIIYNHLNLPQTVTVTGKGTIEYVYDATGNKLRKIVTDNIKIPAIITTTNYINGFVYESKSTVNSGAETLQFISHEEGRFRPQTNQAANQPIVWVSDYFIKDHLGNVRMTLTEETKVVERMLATLENVRLADENLYFDHLVPKVKPPGFDNQGPYNEGLPNENVFISDGNTPMPGMGILLKVTAGDKLKTGVFAHYNDIELGGLGEAPTPQSIAQQLIIALNTSYANMLGQEGLGLINASTNANLTGITSFLNSQNSENPNNDGVKAHLNWMMLDGESLQLIPENSGFVQVPGIDVDLGKVLLQANEGEDIEITRNGYIYIYVNNRGTVPVAFDDLFVIKTKSALLEETHYYPFGLSMSGISSKAASTLENKRKFNDGTELQSKEFSDGSGLEWYATDFRSYDHQIGRLWQIDPLAEITDGISPYAYCSNNPILLNDPTGLLGDSIRTTVLPEVTVTATRHTKAVNNFVDETNKWFGWTGLGWGMYEANKQYSSLGDYMYRNSQGAVHSIFDTKWGSDKTKKNLGNLKNYSKNAQAAIRNTKVVKVLKVGGYVFIFIGVTLDALKVGNAYANNDPKAGEYARKAGLNTGVAIGSAAIPIVGWMVGGIYFLGDEFIPKDANGVGGWERAAESSRQNVQNNREIDPTWSPRPMGGL